MRLAGPSSPRCIGILTTSCASERRLIPKLTFGGAALAVGRATLYRLPAGVWDGGASGLWCNAARAASRVTDGGALVRCTIGACPRMKNSTAKG